MVAYFDNSAVYLKTFWQPWHKQGSEFQELFKTL